MGIRCAVVSVMALGSKMDENKQVDEVHETRKEQEDGSSAVNEDLSNVDQADSSSHKRRSLKGKPRIPSAVDTSRLNKRLTNIWSSKRKKTTKKHPSFMSSDHLQACSSDLEIDSGMELSEHVAADESTEFNSQASTVIIVKTLAQKEDKSDHLPIAQLSKLSGDSGHRFGLEKGSRDIAERLKARRERFTASLGSSTVDASVIGDGKVTCELCAEAVSDYMQLVHHVCEQHEDCTYVRNYLDEIQPIADTLSAISLPCTACGRTFAGQAALSAHRHECTAMGHVSKLGAHRKRVTASLLSPSEHGSGRATVSGPRQNKAARLKTASAADHMSAAVPDGQPDNKCVHCKRKFSSHDNLAKHVLRVHKQMDLKPTKSGRHPKPSTLKLTAVSGSKSQQPPAKSTQLSVSGSTDIGAGRQFQRCDHCSACFSRTSLLVTHMRYCLKADTNR